MSTGPLARFKVIDLTRVRAGPTCVRQLADWGADVIKIEAPEGDAGLGGERHGPDFQNLHRNKRSLTLNLKAPEGLAILKKLVAQADVVVENYRPDVKFRLGVDYESLKAVNKRIVYASISGFGQDGPYRDRPGFDQIAQGMGGLMSITGLPGQGPVRVGIPMDDLTAGNLLAFGVMTALFERQATGVGRWVSTSLLEAQVFMLDFQAARWLMKGEVAGQAGNDHPTSIPTGVFPTSDGHINIAASSGRLWERLCDTIGHPEWKARPEWTSGQGRSRDRRAINALISEITQTQTSEHWVNLFEAAGVPCGPINTIDRVFADPQVRHLKMALPVEHKRLGPQFMVASAINISGVPKDIRTPTPEAGADTDDVMREVGYSDAEIGQMRATGAIK